jgi:hypothetical protein
MIKEVIIQGSYGIFQSTKEFQEYVKSCGYNWWGEIKARTDDRLIKYIKENGLQNGLGVYYLYGKKSDSNIEGYLKIDTVDISKPWTIREYDGAEGIEYFTYEIIDEELNYCR